MIIDFKEIKCSKALTPSKIYGFDYTINPYIGCTHKCSYCYARFMNRFEPYKSWGNYVNIKKNIVQILGNEISKLKPGRVIFSSVTDAYQPIESKYKITRQCLEILNKYNFSVGLLTKSPLITRDIDILHKLNSRKGGLSIGMSIMCLSEEDKNNFEEGSPSIESRFGALKRLNNEGLEPFVFIAPFIPGVSEKNIELLLKRLKECGVKSIMIERLNLRSGNWKDIRIILEDKYLNLVSNYYKDYLCSDYYRNLKQDIRQLCDMYGIKTHIVGSNKFKEKIKNKKITDYL